MFPYHRHSSFSVNVQTKASSSVHQVSLTLYISVTLHVQFPDTRSSFTIWAKIQIHTDKHPVFLHFHSWISAALGVMALKWRVCKCIEMLKDYSRTNKTNIITWWVIVISRIMWEGNWNLTKNIDGFSPSNCLIVIRKRCHCFYKIQINFPSTVFIPVWLSQFRGNHMLVKGGRKWPLWPIDAIFTAVITQIVNMFMIWYKSQGVHVV